MSSCNLRAMASSFGSPAPSRTNCQSCFFIMRRPLRAISTPFCGSMRETMPSRGISSLTGRPSLSCRARLLGLRSGSVSASKLDVREGSVFGSNETVSSPLRIPLNESVRLRKKSCRPLPNSSCKISLAYVGETATIPSDAHNPRGMGMTRAQSGRSVLASGRLYDSRISFTSGPMNGRL